MNRAEKLAELRRKMEESKRENRKDVHAEYARSKVNPREKIRQERKREEAEKLLEEKTAQDNGLDLDRQRGMNWTAEQVEQWEEKQRIKRERAENGFTDYQQIAAKKYKKLTQELKPNIAEYQKQKQEIADAVSLGLAQNSEYKSASLVLEKKPKEDAVNKMTKDLDKHIEKRLKFSRRRKFNEEDDINYISEKNMHFNRKIARAYDKYTAEIKAAFERGTALD